MFAVQPIGSVSVFSNGFGLYLVWYRCSDFLWLTSLMHSAYYANVANGKTNGAGRWPFIDQYFSLPMGDSTQHWQGRRWPFESRWALGKVKYLKVAKPKMKSKNRTLVSRLLDSFSCKNHHAQKKFGISVSVITGRDNQFPAVRASSIGAMP